MPWITVAYKEFMDWHPPDDNPHSMQQFVEQKVGKPLTVTYYEYNLFTAGYNIQYKLNRKVTA